MFDYITDSTPVNDFECCGGAGCTDLEDFLKEEALEVQKQQIACTVVALLMPAVIGYVTYGIDSIRHEYGDAVAVGIDNHIGHSIPALRIYQLAVAQGYDRKGVGTRLIELVFQSLAELRKIVPCPQIVVTSYEDAVGFYEKCGFVSASQPAQKWVTPHKLMFAAFPYEP